MAYYVGMPLGKKIISRPLTSLSPNKSWEGFIGAMLCTVCPFFLIFVHLTRSQVAFAFYVSPYFARNEWLICPSGRFNFDTGLCLQRHPVFEETLYQVWLSSVLFRFRFRFQQATRPS